VSSSGESSTKPVKLFEDGASGTGPNKWFAVFVVVRDERVDTLDELLDRTERASMYALPVINAKKRSTWLSHEL